MNNTDNYENNISKMRMPGRDRRADSNDEAEAEILEEVLEVAEEELTVPEETEVAAEEAKASIEEQETSEEKPESLPEEPEATDEKTVTEETEAPAEEPEVSPEESEANEEKAEEPEEAETPAEAPEVSPEAPEVTAEEEKTQEEQTVPVEEPENDKKKKHGWILALRFILIALIIVGADVIYYVGGKDVEKTLIETKKKLSSGYEQVYRKEVFPKLSTWLVPKWVIEEREAKQKEAKRLEEEAKKQAKAETAQKTVDVLEGVPQIPEGLEYFPAYSENGVIYGRNGWLYSTDSNSIDYFIGANVLSDDVMADYCNRLETLGKICKDRGVELIMMVGPNKEQVFPENYPSIDMVTNYKRLIMLEKYMKEHCSVPFLYPVRELSQNKDQYETYWKYDTHWNTTGAFVAMKAIYNALGRPIDDSNITRYEEGTARGDLSYVVGYYEPYTDYVTIYKPDEPYDMVVFNSDWDIDNYGVIYTSAAPTDKNLVVVGDSFRIELGKHMCKDYNTTTVFHRNIVFDDIPVESLRNLKEGDTLVLITVERWDYQEFDAINSIISIMQ